MINTAPTPTVIMFVYTYLNYFIIVLFLGFSKFLNVFLYLNNTLHYPLFKCVQ